MEKEKENQEKEEGVIVEFKKGYITMQWEVDAIVNDANAELTVGKGISMEIHHRAGPQLYEECKSLAPLKTGQAVITKGYELSNPYVIHTLGPVYAKEENPAEKLALCYKNCLRRAEEKKLSSIAFSTISVENSGYPLKEAAEIALQATCEESINLKYLKTMFFVFNDSETKDIYYDTFYRRLEEARREEHEKFLKEEPDIELSEEIKNLSPWKRERFYEFTKKFLIKGESEPYRKEPDSPYGGYFIPWMKATVYFYCDNKKSQIEQDEECREIESFIGHLRDSGVGILVYRAVYCWNDTSNGKIYRLQKEGDGFVDVVGNFEYSLENVSEDNFKKYFSNHPECDGRRGFTIELIVSDLRFFMKKFDEYLQEEKQQKENTDIKNLDVAKGLNTDVEQQAQEKQKQEQFTPIDVTEGTKWEDITIDMISFDCLNITIGDNRPIKKHAGEIGCIDRRHGEHKTRMWRILGLFCKTNGLISWQATESMKIKEKAAIKKNVSDTRKLLTKLIPNCQDTPIAPYIKRVGYKAHFKATYSCPVDEQKTLSTKEELQELIDTQFSEDANLSSDPKIRKQQFMQDNYMKGDSNN